MSLTAAPTTADATPEAAAPEPPARRSEPEPAGPRRTEAAAPGVAARRAAAAPEPGSDGPRPSELAALVAQLAPLLGLDPGRIDVRAGPSSARPGAISLARAERGLVAHELAHVVQHANRARPDVTRAEAEAAGLAQAARAGMPLWVPRAALPSGHVARDLDAGGVAPEAPPPDLAKLEHDLAELVFVNHWAERARILSELGAVFATTSGSVEASLHVLDTLPFVTARALVRSLPSDKRMYLAHLDDGAHKHHPRSAVAVLAALSDSEIIKLRNDRYDGLRAAAHGLDAASLEPDELRAALGVLARAPEAELLALMRGDRRDDFRKLAGTTPPPGTELEALTGALAHEKRIADAFDSALSDRVKAALEQGPHEGLKALETLTMLASEELQRGKPAGNAPPTAGERLRNVVALQDASGRIEKRILDKLPEEDRYGEPYGTTLRYVLAARNPALNLARAESLLSYGLFDWAIRDSEDRFAYLLVRSTPIAVQDAWRRRDDGLWFRRLTENLPEAMITNGEYSGVGSEFATGLPAGEEPASTAVMDELAAVLALWRPQRVEPNAKIVARRLLGRAPAGQPLGGADTRPLRLMVVRRLDATPEAELNQVVAKLPDEYVLGEEGRQELLDLSGMRDPYRLELQAMSLLETGFSDWWVNSKEAWIAYQLIRALPVTAQERFAADDPGRWTKMRNALTTEMKGSMAAGVTTGRGPFPGRDALRKRLSDQRLWDREHALELRALIVLTYASDDKKFVFDLSKELRADKRPGLYAALGELGLYDEVLGPQEFVGENLETRGGGFELLRFIDDQFPFRWVLVGLGAWLFMDWISISGYSVQVKEFDLAWAQWAMGGDLGGARLEDDPPPPKYKVAGAPPPIKANRISMEADLGTGAVRLRLPQLKLASTNFMRGGASYRSGPVQIDNLRVKASFSDRHYKEPVGAEIDADSVDIRDLVLANPSLPAGAWALAHLLTQPLHVKTGATGDEDLAARAPRGGTLPIPVFGPIFQALANVVAIKGGIPFSPTVVDLLLLPIPDLPFGTGTVANALLPTPAPADYLWGLATDGVLRPPRSVADRAKDAADMLRSFEISFDKLVIEGLSVGADTQIASITLTDVDVGVGLSRPAYLRVLLRSLERVRKGMTGEQATATDERIAKAKAELDSLLAAEARLEELERKDRWEPGSLSPGERRDLAKLSDALRADAGIVADIGSIEVGPLSGRIAAGGARFEGIHIDAHAPLGPKGYLADETLIERLRAGGPKPIEAAELFKRSEALITIESTKLLDAPDGGVALSVAAEKLPTAAELRERLKAMNPLAPAELRQRVEDALALVEAADRLRAQKQTIDTRQQILVHEDRARRLLGVMVGSASFGRITGALDPTTGRLTARVHDADVRDIYADGFAVRRVGGDVELGVGGLAGLGDIRTIDKQRVKGALTGSFGLDATVEGIQTEMGTIGTVAIAGLRGDVIPRGDVYRLQDVWADSITISAINIGMPGLGVTGKTVTIEGLGMNAELSAGQIVVERLDIAKLSADTVVYDGGEVHAEVKGGALTGIHVENLDYGGGGLMSANVTVAGVQDLRYKLVLGALTSGRHTVEGTLQGGGKDKPAVISAQYAVTAGGKTVGLQVKDLEALGTTVTTPDGSVVIKRVVVGTTLDISKDGTKATVALRDLNISHVNWRAGTMTITSDGAITLKSLDASASLDKAGNLRIHSLDITEVAADDLHVKDGALDLHLGEVKGHPDALKIAGIHLRDFELPKGGKPTSGHLEVTDFHVDFGGTLAAGLEARGGIEAKKITLDFMRGDKLVARATGLAVDVLVDAGTFETNVAFTGVDTGNIVVDPTGITVEGLVIGLITLEKLYLNTKLASGKRLQVFSDRVAGGGRVHIVNLQLKAHADRTFKRIELTQFEIERIDFEGLVLELPDDHVVITVPVLSAPAAGGAAPIASLRKIKLEGLKGPGDPFVITPGSSHLLEGVARLDATSIPKLEVEVKDKFLNDKFKGAVELSTEKASIGFLASGDTVIDVNRPRLKMTDPATLSSKKQTILVQELGAENVHVEGGKTKITGAGVKGVTYKQPGVEVKIDKATAPGVTEVTDITGHIPELKLEGAYVRVDFTALPKGSGGSSGAVEIGDLAPLMDSLGGDLSMVVLLRVSIPAFDDQDLRIPVALHFEDGKLNFNTLTRSLQGKIGAKDADEADDKSYIIEELTSQPEFVIQGSDLVFRLRIADIVVLDVGPPQTITKEIARWNLTKGELKVAQDQNLVRVFRLTLPAPDPDKKPGEPSAVHLDTLEFQEVDADLNVKSKDPIPITFTSPGARGTVTLAPDALLGLRAKGGLPPNTRPESRAMTSRPFGLHAVEVDNLNIQSTDLHFGLTDVSTGTIAIEKLRDGTLTFSGHTPKVLTARIETATAKDIKWLLAP